MTENEIVTRAYEALRLLSAAVGESHIPRLHASLPVVRQRVSWRVAESDDEQVRNLLRKSYALTVTANIGDASALMAGVNPPLAETLERAEIRFPSSLYASTKVADRASLSMDWPAGYIYHAVEGTVFYFRNFDGLLDSLTEEAQLVTNYLMTDLTTVTHRQIETMMIDELVTAATKAPMPAAHGEERAA